MASGNRVEELESRVKELEASITGLTDELVECKERLRVLEDEVDPDFDIIEGQKTGEAERAAADGGEDETADSDNTGADEGEDDTSDEIIVA